MTERFFSLITFSMWESQQTNSDSYGLAESEAACCILRLSILLTFDPTAMIKLRAISRTRPTARRRMMRRIITKKNKKKRKKKEKKKEKKKKAKAKKKKKTKDKKKKHNKT